MNKKEFKKKWNGKDRENLSPAELEEFLCDSYEMYENQGYAPLFHTPYTENESRIGQPFKVIRRATLEDCDLDAMPMWQIRFEDGTETFAYPEEIIQGEQKWTFAQRLDLLKKELVAKINAYDGPKRIQLSTAEYAVDCDDAWLIIGDGQPRLRDKRDQRIMEKDPSWAKESFNEDMEDFLEDYNIEDLIRFGEENKLI